MIASSYNQEQEFTTQYLRHVVVSQLTQFPRGGWYGICAATTMKCTQLSNTFTFL
jgi:hypothetical protein